jgi:hypothetical protein
MSFNPLTFKIAVLNTWGNNFTSCCVRLRRVVDVIKIMFGPKADRCGEQKMLTDGSLLGLTQVNL